MKKEYGYVFYPEAYAELQALCNDCFPTDEAFYEKAKDMNKTLMQLDGKDFPQAEFAYYIQRCPFSTKTYAGDFMQEIYDLFIRDIVTTAERSRSTGMGFCCLRSATGRSGANPPPSRRCWKRSGLRI